MIINTNTVNDAAGLNILNTEVDYGTAVKRLNYFQGEFLREGDFRDEQQYHLNMRRYHNQVLHTWGIADGLVVTPVTGENKITVTKGMAIDGWGREIILAEDKELDLSGTTGAVYVTISYREMLTDIDEEGDITGPNNPTRITEEPAIICSADPPADPTGQLILAQVIFNEDAGIESISPLQRQYAGAVAHNLTLHNIAFTLPPAVQQLQLLQQASTGILAQANQQPQTVLQLLGETGQEVNDTLTETPMETPMVSRLAINTNTGSSSIINSLSIGGAWINYRQGETPLKTIFDIGSRGDIALMPSGNVGIGTDSPESKLYIRDDKNGELGAVLGIVNRGGESSGTAVAVKFGVDPANSMATQASGEIQVANTGQEGALAMSFSLWNGTETKECLRLNSNGNIGIGATASDKKLEVAGDALITGNLVVEGTINGREWTQISNTLRLLDSSDIRLKTNIKPLTNVLEKLEQIRGISFEWNESYAPPEQAAGHRELGVIAQEVEAVFPELVATDPENGYKRVNYPKLTAVLIEAVKELKANYDQLAARVAIQEREA